MEEQVFRMDVGMKSRLDDFEGMDASNLEISDGVTVESGKFLARMSGIR